MERDVKMLESCRSPQQLLPTVSAQKDFVDRNLVSLPIGHANHSQESPLDESRTERQSRRGSLAQIHNPERPKELWCNWTKRHFSTVRGRKLSGMLSFFAYCSFNKTATTLETKSLNRFIKSQSREKCQKKRLQK